MAELYENNRSMNKCLYICRSVQRTAELSKPLRKKRPDAVARVFTHVFFVVAVSLKFEPANTATKEVVTSAGKDHTDRMIIIL